MACFAFPIYFFVFNENDSNRVAEDMTFNTQTSYTKIKEMDCSIRTHDLYLIPSHEYIKKISMFSGAMPSENTIFCFVLESIV